MLEPPTPIPLAEKNVAVVALHGGAGATTLSMLLHAGVDDAGTQLPAANPYVSARPRVLFVARTHARGLEAAETATTAWSHGELPAIDLVGLVLVDDGPKLSSQTRHAVARILRKTPHGWHIPWVEAWRTTAAPAVSGVRLPRTLKSIRNAAGVPVPPKGTPS